MYIFYLSTLLVTSADDTAHAPFALMPAPSIYSFVRQALDLSASAIAAAPSGPMQLPCARFIVCLIQSFRDSNPTVSLTK